MHTRETVSSAVCWYTGSTASNDLQLPQVLQAAQMQTLNLLMVQAAVQLQQEYVVQLVVRLQLEAILPIAAQQQLGLTASRTVNYHYSQPSSR